MPQQRQEATTKVSKGEAVGLLYLFASSHAAAITPFIRSGLGLESFGIKAIIALVVMAALSEGRWSSPMGIYLILWFAALAYRRVETFNNWRKGVVTHSLHIGDPWLAMKLVTDPSLARKLEPFLCLAIGAALCVISKAVGIFVMWGFASLAVCMGIEQFAVYKRVQHMNDAVIEGEHYGEAFRRGR